MKQAGKIITVVTAYQVRNFSNGHLLTAEQFHPFRHAYPYQVGNGWGEKVFLQQVCYDRLWPFCAIDDHLEQVTFECSVKNLIGL
jgi:hypothetical protein